MALPLDLAPGAGLAQHVDGAWGKGRDPEPDRCTGIERPGFALLGWFYRARPLSDLSYVLITVFLVLHTIGAIRAPKKATWWARSTPMT